MPWGLIQHVAQIPLVHGALTGWASAAVVDLHAFTSWHSWSDAKKYDWGVATFRWVVGAVTGAAMAVGMGAVLGVQ